MIIYKQLVLSLVMIKFTSSAFSYQHNKKYQLDPNSMRGTCESNGAHYQITNRSLGTVNYTVFVPSSPNPIIELQWLGQQCNLTGNFTGLVHSKKLLETDNDIFEGGNVQVTFNYVFSGCYRIEIDAINLTCISQPFMILTNYKRQKIEISKVILSPQYDERSKQITSNINFGHSFPLNTYPDTIVVKLNTEIDLALGDCTGTGKREACCSLGEDKGDCCNGDEWSSSQCLCEWVDTTTVCTFPNVAPGNYCIVVEIVDTRCEKNTLWMNQGLHCIWYNTFSFSSSNRSSVLVSNKLYSKEIILPVACLGLVLLLVCLLLFYFRARQKKIHQTYSSFDAVNKSVNINVEAPQILLLYPRDNNEFMNMMTIFRNLLRDTLHAKVYDLWASENWDSVAENGLQWALKYLTDPSIKVIVVASVLSKKIEEGLSEGKNIIYDRPHPLDTVYISSLKYMIEMSNMIQHKYKRIFVVRFDGLFVEGLKFKCLNLCTLYTLPNHLRDLVMDVYNMNATHVIVNPEKLSLIDQLSKAISSYDNSCSIEPNYAEKLIEIVEPY